MSMPDQLRLFEALAHADPAVSWCVMIGCDAGYYSSFLDDDAGRELWPELDMVTAGWVAPAGRARPVDGGFVVDGRWSFGSGCTHADVIIGGCTVVDDDGRPDLDDAGIPRMRVIAAPAASFEVIDTWHTTGLAGSGSNDYTCRDLFVPTSHTFTLTDPVRRTRPLYRFPGAFTTKFHGVTLGLARRALDEVAAVAQQKVLPPQMVVMRDVPRVQAALAEAEADLRATSAYSHRAVGAMWQALVEERPLTPELRVDMLLSRVHAARTAREVTLQAVQLVGTQAIYTSSILDQLLRDAVTIGQHVVAGPMSLELAGALLLGIEPTGPLAAIA
jgi:alkylation response protein AidB-like acyl-CoA dehydrogenase